MLADKGKTVAFENTVKEDFALSAFILLTPEQQWPDLTWGSTIVSIS
jgi:hypothetical protein